jgi:hypothetical protein
MEMENITIAAAIIGSFALGVGAASVLHAQGTAPWWDSEGHKYTDFRAIGVEGVEPK